MQLVKIAAIVILIGLFVALAAAFAGQLSVFVDGQEYVSSSLERPDNVSFWGGSWIHWALDQLGAGGYESLSDVLVPVGAALVILALSAIVVSWAIKIISA